MKVSLLTDAPKHNLALMKLSAWHKANGDEVMLNAPIFPADYTYASVLFENNINLFEANEYGGPAYVSMRLRDKNGYVEDGIQRRNILDKDIEYIQPDYELFGLDYSLGYSYRPCFNTCSFCKVPTFDHPDIGHHSIFDFHRSNFKKICLLNNNTFQDPRWKETFEEIWDADLTVIDENGYDLRLIDDEKAEALKKTKFQGKLHFAWDRMQDEPLMVEGLKTLRKHKISGSGVYVLIGYNTTIEEDIYRCQKITESKQDVYIMPYKKTKQNMRFKRFMSLFMWRKYKTIEEAWSNYTP